MLEHRHDPPPLIWPTGKGRKTSGGDITTNSHFPEAWQGALFVGGYINNAIWSLRIVEDDSGFRLEDLPPLIKSTSRSFRPVDVKFGPEAALYICDWSNPIIGHYQASFRHPDRDKTHGRIWRVTAGDALFLRGHDWWTCPAELLDQLRSNDRWTRHFAKRVLADRPTEEVVAALKQWTTGSGLSSTLWLRRSAFIKATK